MWRRPRRLGLLPLVGLLVLAAAHVAPERDAEGPLVVISIDGLRPDYVREADRHGLRIPELRRLLREGASASGVVGVLPTVTYPSHATLVTGVAPARHGILANRPFDPLGQNHDGWYWYAEDLRVPALWDVAAAAGWKTASVDWPVTVGARIDWNVPQIWRANSDEDAKLVRAVGTPGLLAEAERVLGPWPHGSRASLEKDERKAVFNAWLLRTRRPRLHFAYFASLDEEQHASGPGSPATLRTLEALDRRVGELRRAASSYGRPTLAVVSDHGFARTDRELSLEGPLRRAGLIRTDVHGRVSSWRAQVWEAGGTAAVVLAEVRDEEARHRVAALLDRLQDDEGSGVERVLSRQEAAARGGFAGADFVVGLRPGTGWGRSAMRGEHGFLPENPEMDAAFLLCGPGVPAGLDLGRIDMRDVAPTLAGRLGLRLPRAEGRDRIGLALGAEAPDSGGLGRELEPIRQAFGQVEAWGGIHLFRDGGGKPLRRDVRLTSPPGGPE